MNVIYKTIPKHTEGNVALDSILELHFMIDMNKNTFLPENVVLFNLSEQAVEPVSIEYNRRILKVKPTQKLKAKNRYQLQLVAGEKGLKDIVGRQMAQTYELEFVTKDVESIKPPVILSPTDVSVVYESATFQLEPNLDADYYEMQISKSNTFHHLEWPTNEEKVYRTPDISVTPDVPYQTGLYYMRVRSVGFDKETSAWSDTIRFFYDGSPVIQEQPEELMPDETAIESETPLEEAGETQTGNVVLQAVSQIKEESQLSTLQDAFAVEVGESVANLLVKSATPRDKSVHNNVSTFNNLTQTGNQKRIVITFTEDIDPASVNADGKPATAYVLSERN